MSVVQVKGVVFMCNKCLEILVSRAGKSIDTQPELAEESFCVWCRGQEELRRVPALVANPYNPDDTKTTNCPEGEPWYITGYLPPKEEP